MPRIVIRNVHGHELAHVSMSQQDFDEIHTLTVDRDKHRLYFSLKYTFHAELKPDQVPASEGKKKPGQKRGK